MKIQVKVAGGKVRRVQIKENSTIFDLLKKLGVNREIVAVRVSGKVVPEEEPLKDGDRVDVFQIVTGG